MSEWPPGFTFRPIEQWPGETTRHRRTSPFRAGMTQTLPTLTRELWHLSARERVMQIAVRERDIRLDGAPRADARPEHPGIIIAFESKYGPLQYACDRFTHWIDNLRAIALGLEALRKVDRYGITKRGEQYTGWAKLPPGTGQSNGVIVTMTVVQAREFLSDITGFPPNASDMRPAYREAAKRLHPDLGGDPAGWNRLQQAKTVLGLR